MSCTLSIENIDLEYAGQTIVQDFSLHMEAGEIGCLLGPSGCGKTTILRAIAGFEPVAAGRIALNDELLSSPHVQRVPEQRRIGMVFQDFALFPHLRVIDNIGFGLRQWPRQARRERIRQLLDLVGLNRQARAWPHELSGGQQQRVALARALAPRPRLLLLDEPFSSLDASLRETLATEVASVLREEGISALLVTHDQREAFAMADRIAVLNQGQLQQWDSAYNLYHRPANRFVARFIGEGAFIPGQVRNGCVDTELGVISGDLPANCGERCLVDVLIRPDDLIHDDQARQQAKVVARAFRGSEFLYTLVLAAGSRVLCLVPSHHDHAIGEMIGIRLDFEHLVMFPR